MTPAANRAEAERLLHAAQSYGIHVPARADLLQQATVYALLGLAPEPLPSYSLAMPDDVRVADLVDAASRATGTPADTLHDMTAEEFASYVATGKPKPAPRKRAARKTTAPKETSK